ncbi:MAG: hypothetical protein M0Z84_08430 [Gammaproteobacteria bacterium]|nr:hypothetical protein [Gammaproteobacteria bacterium]
MSAARIQMAFIALVGFAATIGSFVYLLAKPPAYLRATRDGVPFFTPPVINPVDGKPLSVNTLVRDYKGVAGPGPAAGVD